MLNLKSGKHFTEPSARSQMTRGGFLKGILASGIAPSITMGVIANAGSANASVGRGMMRNVGVRNAAMFGGDKPTAKDYVQDGLIAHWDGIENGGYGIHIGTSSNWKDLKGIYTSRQTQITSLTFDEKFAIFNGNNSVDSGSTFGSPSNVTLEVVFRVTHLDNTLRICNSIGQGGFGIERIIGEDHPYFYFAANNGSYRFAISDELPVLNKTFQFSGISSSDGVSLFKFGGNKVFTPISSMYVRWNRYLYIGSMQSSFDFVRAKIGCVRLYSRAISEDEVSHNYNVDRARFDIV